MGNREIVCGAAPHLVQFERFRNCRHPSRGLGPSEIACSHLRASRHRGVVKSLAGFYCGPVGLLHSQKTGIKYKKPSYSGLRGECSAWICCRVSRAIDPQFCKPKVGSSILSTGTIKNACK